jgi:hypothetical protein
MEWSESARAGRYRQAKATKCGETGDEQSECSVVLLKRGNQPKGPCGGKGASEDGTAGGKDERDFEPGQHLNETAADSASGAGRSPSVTQRIHSSEEPDAGNPHVRICGSLGWVTTRGHPACAGQSSDEEDEMT